MDDDAPPEVWKEINKDLDQYEMDLRQALEKKFATEKPKEEK